MTSPFLSLSCVYGDHSRFFSSPEQEAPVFPSGPCPLSRTGMPSSRVGLQHPRPGIPARRVQQPQRPKTPPFSLSGARRGCRPAGWAPRVPYLQCRMAHPRLPPAQHPRASFLQRDGCERGDVTGGGPHAATWRLGPRRGGGGGKPRKTLEDPGSSRLLPPCWAACLMCAAFPAFHRLWETGRTQKEKSQRLQAPSM